MNGQQPEAVNPRPKTQPVNPASGNNWMYELMYQHRSLITAGALLLLSACGSSPDEAASPDTLHVSCLEPPNTSVCRAAKPAFYYDYQSDSCKRFNWGGCGANVPFQSMDQCVKTCGGRAAP
jgi:hypothetical protein